MGVPKFFKWLVDNCPSTIFFDPKLHIDNLFLDMNCLIHPCCREKNENGDLPKNEEEMISKVIAYVDKLIKISKPKNSVYLAIDGVAPCAKMCQQRLRRFKSILIKPSHWPTPRFSVVPSRPPSTELSKADWLLSTVRRVLLMCSEASGWQASATP